METAGLMVYLPVLALLAFVAVLLVALSAMRSSRRRRAEEASTADFGGDLGAFETMASVLPGRGSETSGQQYAGPAALQSLEDSDSVDATGFGQADGQKTHAAQQHGHGEGAPGMPAAETADSWGRHEAMAWLAHRAHTCSERQLDLIHEFRGSQQSEGRDLFPMEHLATQTRRAIDGILVLAGEPAYRAYSRPVPLSEVVRSAALSLPSYDRVDLDLEFDPQLDGQVATGLSHLLAEVIDPLLQRRTRAVVSCQRARDGFEIAVSDEDEDTGKPPAEGMSDHDVHRGMAWLVHPEGSPERPEDLAFAVAGEVARALRMSVRLGRGWDGATVVTVPLPARLLAGAALPASSVAAAPAGTAVESPAPPPAAVAPAAEIGVPAPVVPGPVVASPVAPSHVAAGNRPPQSLHESFLPAQAGAVEQQPPAPARPMMRSAGADVLPGRPAPGAAPGTSPFDAHEEEQDGVRTGRKRRRGPRKRKNADASASASVQEYPQPHVAPSAAEHENPAPHAASWLPAGGDVVPGHSFPEQRQESPAAPTPVPVQQRTEEEAAARVPVRSGGPSWFPPPPSGDEPSAGLPGPSNAAPRGQAPSLPQFNGGGEDGPRGQSFAPLPATPAEAPAAQEVTPPFATREEPRAEAEESAEAAGLAELSRLFGGGDADKPEGTNGA